MTNPKEVAMAAIALLLLMRVARITSATSFAYNGFKASDGLIFLEGASLDRGRLSLTKNGVQFYEGRVLYPVPIRNPFDSFSMSFIFTIVAGLEGHAQGMAFLIAPNASPVVGANGSYLGLFNDSANSNPSTRTFAVELDTYLNPEFQDEDDNHVGIDINSAISVMSTFPVFLNSPAFRTSDDGTVINLKSGQANQIWIDYDANRTELNIWISGKPGLKPSFPFLSDSSLNLSATMALQNNGYIGFSASTAYLTDTSCFVHAWSFSNEGPSPDINLPITSQNRGTYISNILIGVFSSFAIALCALLGAILIIHRWRKKKQDESVLSLPEGMDLSRSPQRLTYKELHRATQGFSEKNLLGKGGFGSVYRGTLLDGTVIAVKRVSKGSQQGMKEFIAEISSIGRLRHRHLVPLLGWCPDRGLALVYDYMPNGSLDSYLFKRKKKMATTEEQETDKTTPIMDWAARCKILQGVASALVYLHEEWEQKIVHRDVKASNVLLDREFNARLGDFGLARLNNHDSGTSALTTDVAGTFGYLAPEYILTRKFTDKVDVYSFGALVLEVLTGRRIASETLDIPLVDWLWRLQSGGELSEAIDSSLLETGMNSEHDAGVEMLKLGLLCMHPNAGSRPSMRRVLQVMLGDAPLPTLPLTRPPLVIPDLSISLRFEESWSSSPTQSLNLKLS